MQLVVIYILDGHALNVPGVVHQFKPGETSAPGVSGRVTMVMPV